MSNAPTLQTIEPSVRRVGIADDMIHLFFRNTQALDAALGKLPAMLANHPRTQVERSGTMPQLWLPILPTLH